jgi:hypothetical protein
MSKLYSSVPSRWIAMRLVFAVVMLHALIGCGGGSQGSQPPPPDFSISVNPTSQTVNAGSSAFVSLSATALSGFSSQVSVQVTGLPTGVSVSPSTIALAPGTPQQVTFTAATSATNSSGTVTFTGTAGSSTHTTALSLTVTAPDFSLAVNPTSQSVNAGGSASVSLSATALNGFASQISVQTAGVPAGISVLPSSSTLVPGTPQQITFTAAANVASSNPTITFTGTSGSLTHTATVNLTVNGSSNGAPVRTRYVRTDATTEYFGWVNQHSVIYHAPTARYFVTDPSSNQIIVIDGASQTEIATIPVPGAFGMDDTPDHTTLYVGTMLGDVYAIDPVGMAVIHRYIASEIGPYGYLTLSALVLADGRLALLGAQGGIPSVDGSTTIAVWSPADNSITIYGSFGGVQGVPLPCGGFMGNIGGFARTVDRTQIILGSIDSDGTLCEINEATGQGIYGTAVSFSLYHITTSPDGKYIIQPNYPTGVVLYDVHTLIPVAQFDVLGDNSSASGFAVSPDSTTLFTPTDSIVYAYDIATQKLIGWAPNIFVPPTSSGGAVGPIDSPFMLATDGTGLYVGPLEEGVGFVDLSMLQTGPVGTQFTNAYLNPATGSVSGGTQTQWSSQMLPSEQGAVYFGSEKASQVSNSNGNITATTPAGSPGPIPVYAFSNDGGLEIIPDGFSYGPTILEVTPSMATAEGGGPGYIYGYGFGPVNSNTIPSDLKVTVGGMAANITAFSANAYGLSSPPFPLQSFAYTIPPGVSGSAVSVVVSTGAGSATTTAALTYLPAIQQFPLAGSTLAQGIYDPYTDLYYFTDATELQVFSRTQGKWLSPISISPPPGAKQTLWGIALSPDGSKLAVSDATAGVIYRLNPTNTTSVQTFAVNAGNVGLVNPSGLAISDSGIVYYTVCWQGISGASGFFKLDTNTGIVTNYQIQGPGGPEDVYLRDAISSDNSRVFFNDEGYVFSIDAATDTVFSAADGYGCCYGNYELALSSNQTQFTATFYLYDSDLNGESYYTLNDREIFNILYVYGAKLSPDGRLLFQPSTNGIDVFDGELGNLRNRISLPVVLSPNFDALADDGTDNILVAITGTGNGIAIIDLTSVSEPPPLPYETRSASRTHRLVELDNRWRGDSKLREHPDKQNLRPATQSRTVPHVTRTLLPHPK